MVNELPRRHRTSRWARLVRLVSTVAVISLVASACGSGASESSETTPTSAITDGDDSDDLFVETPIDSSGTSETGAPTETRAPSETTTPAETRAPDAPSEPSDRPPAETPPADVAPVTTLQRTDATPHPDTAISITEIDFDAGTITISNHGDADVELGDIWICEFPAYTQLDAGTLPAGEQVTLPNPQSSSPDDGELALYRTDDFADADAILSYVEWGSAGHMRASVAVKAGVWGDDAVVTGPILGTSGAFAIDASGWSVIATSPGGSGAPTPPADPPPDDYAPAAPPPPNTAPSEPPPPPDDY